MKQASSLLYNLRHNDKLPIRIISPTFGHLTAEEAILYTIPLHTPYFLFLFVRKGCSRHTVDLSAYEVSKDELLFVMPHQVQGLPAMEPGTDFFKLGIDEYCLALLPKQYPFLIDPLHHQKVYFSGFSASRVKAILAMLLELLSDWHTEPELILAHLHSLMTEINTAYFCNQRVIGDSKLSTFIAFKDYVEQNLTAHPGIGRIAEALGINTNGLYQLTRQYAGVSPKAFINQRLMLEARRRIYYASTYSIKELAFELGFNDPDYFSRLFKKVTGQTIAQFSQDSSGK